MRQPRLPIQIACTRAANERQTQRRRLKLMPCRRGLILTAVSTGALVVAAVLLLGRDGPGNGLPDGWTAYENDEHGYEIAYPADWQITVRPTRCDAEDPDFCIQSIRLE